MNNLSRFTLRALLAVSLLVFLSGQTVLPRVNPGFILPGDLAGEMDFAPMTLQTETVSKVSAGMNHTCAIMEGGVLKCWGDNFYGQLGDGTTIDKPYPVDVINLGSPVVAVSAGNYHTCAVLATGALKCWGINYFGQLGDGTTEMRPTPVAVSGLGSGVVAVSAGGAHTCARLITNALKCWGRNSDGQLGNGTVNTNANSFPLDVSGMTTNTAAVSIGENHTCALTTGGGVKCWGDNSSGQLGDNSTTDRSSPVDVYNLSSGTTGIDSGRLHTCALVNGGVKCWGNNAYGQLGNGTLVNEKIPVDVSGLTSGAAAVDAGWGHTCARTTSQGLLCWGYNNSGTLGDGTTTSQSVPLQVPSLETGVTEVSAGTYHTCAIQSELLKCWGDNPDGQLGDGTVTNQTMPRDVIGLNSGVGSLSAGGFHTCALLSAGGLKCWGDNFYGQLGDGTTVHHSIPDDVIDLDGETILEVSAGGSHTCVVLAGGQAKCWGYNHYGQVGDGTTSDRTTPTSVEGLEGGEVLAISAGGSHTCAVMSGGGVKCWGYNIAGQLGDGSTDDSDLPVDVVGLGGPATAISAGWEHTCALLENGGVDCWGRNMEGQLGDGTTDDRYNPVAVMELGSVVTSITSGYFHTCARTLEDGLKCWGSNDIGQLGDGSGSSQLTPVDVFGLQSGAAAVSAGEMHSCGLTLTGALKCWGDNYYGQLGTGTLDWLVLPGNVIGMGNGVTGLDAGWEHTCALVTGGGVKCWGNNTDGQLGWKVLWVPIVVQFPENKMFMPAVMR